MRCQPRGTGKSRELLITREKKIAGIEVCWKMLEATFSCKLMNPVADEFEIDRGRGDCWCG